MLVFDIIADPGTYTEVLKAFAVQLVNNGAGIISSDQAGAYARPLICST